MAKDNREPDDLFSQRLYNMGYRIKEESESPACKTFIVTAPDGSEIGRVDYADYAWNAAQKHHRDNNPEPYIGFPEIFYTLHRIDYETNVLIIQDGIAPAVLQHEITKAMAGFKYWKQLGANHFQSHRGFGDGDSLQMEIFAIAGEVRYKFRDFGSALGFKNWAKENGLDLFMIGLNAGMLETCLFTLKDFTPNPALMVLGWRCLDLKFPRQHLHWLHIYNPGEPREIERW